MKPRPDGGRGVGEHICTIAHRRDDDAVARGLLRAQGGGQTPAQRANRWIFEEGPRLVKGQVAALGPYSLTTIASFGLAASRQRLSQILVIGPPASSSARVRRLSARATPGGVRRCGDGAIRSITLASTGSFQCGGKRGQEGAR